MMSPDDLAHDDNMTCWHLASLFMSKAFAQCKQKGVTPRTSGDEVNLLELIEEAEKELGIYVPPEEIEMMNKFPRMKTNDEIRRRRAFAFSSLIRMTSSEVKP